MSTAYEKVDEQTLDSTQVVYTDVLDYQGFQNAQQIEVKADVTAGDGSVDFSVEVSDDGQTWFEVDLATFTIAAIGKDGIILDAQGNYMRVKLDYTHNSADTTVRTFMLCR